MEKYRVRNLNEIKRVLDELSDKVGGMVEEEEALSPKFVPFSRLCEGIMYDGAVGSINGDSMHMSNSKLSLLVVGVDDEAEAFVRFFDDVMYEELDILDECKYDVMASDALQEHINIVEGNCAELCTLLELVQNAEDSTGLSKLELLAIRDFVGDTALCYIMNDVNSGMCKVYITVNLKKLLQGYDYGCD